MEFLFNKLNFYIFYEINSIFIIEKIRYPNVIVKKFTIIKVKFDNS